MDEFGNHRAATLKIAHIVFEAPRPDGSGAALRNHALGLCLAELGTFTSVVMQDYFPDGKRHPDRRRSFIEANIPAATVDDVARRIAACGADLVVVDGVYLADIARRLVAKGGQVIVDMHNVESSLLKEVDLARRPWRAALFYRQRWARAVAAEKDLAQAVAGFWVCSKSDADLMRAIVGTSSAIAIVPNPVPGWCATAAQASSAAPWSVRALFVGHLGYRPNIVAASRLIRQMLPRIRDAFPGSILTICGRAPGKALQKLAAGRVGLRLIGDPVDLAPFYRDATVAVIPLTEGGGTRLKVLEAMAMGLPVVATSKSVEGLNLLAGQTYLAAETDADFVEAIGRLAESEELRGSFSAEGRRFVAAHHSQQALNMAVSAALSRWHSPQISTIADREI